MAKSAMQKSKILYLMKIFCERTDDEHGLTVNELIDELEAIGISAERKSIYDDIETLRAYGLDIEMRKDKNFRYHLISRDLELAELKLLVDSVQASKFISHQKSLELIKKLEALTSKHQARTLSRQVYIANRAKTMNQSIYYTVDNIHEAISQNSQISYQYFDWSVDKEKVLRHNGKVYQVSPWALTIEDENYYLIAYDSEAEMIKHFRVDKMLGLRIVDIPRDGEEVFEDFDLALYVKKTFGMYSGEETLITLRCKNSMANIIIDRFGADVTFFKRSDGYFDVNVKVVVSPVFLSWLTIFDDNIEVVAPQHVRENLALNAQKILERYR